MPDAKLYNVTNVSEQTRPDPQGRLRRVSVIAYEVPSRRFFGTLEVSLEDSTPEKVKALLEAEVKRIVGLYSL